MNALFILKNSIFLFHAIYGSFHLGIFDLKQTSFSSYLELQNYVIEIISHVFTLHTYMQTPEAHVVFFMVALKIPVPCIHHHGTAMQ